MEAAVAMESPTPAPRPRKRSSYVPVRRMQLRESRKWLQRELQVYQDFLARRNIPDDSALILSLRTETPTQTPEQKLWQAVVLDAVQLFLFPARAVGKLPGPLTRDIRLLRAHEFHYLMSRSFEDHAAMGGLDPDKVRLAAGKCLLEIQNRLDTGDDT